MTDESRPPIDEDDPCTGVEFAGAYFLLIAVALAILAAAVFV